MFGDSPAAGPTSSSGLPDSIGHSAYTPVLACLSAIFYSRIRYSQVRASPSDESHMRSSVSESPVVCEIARRPSRATEYLGCRVPSRRRVSFTFGLLIVE